jgi:hypothetical protein
MEANKTRLIRFDSISSNIGNILPHGPLLLLLLLFLLLQEKKYAAATENVKLDTARKLMTDAPRVVLIDKELTQCALAFCS